MKNCADSAIPFGLKPLNVFGVESAGIEKNNFKSCIIKNHKVGQARVNSPNARKILCILTPQLSLLFKNKIKLLNLTSLANFLGVCYRY
jgi:hypothetical protein